MPTPEEMMEAIGAGPWTDSPSYIRMDECRALDLFVRQATRTLDRVKDDVGEWMLVLESIQAAAQIAIVAHLSGSARIGAQTASSAKRVLNGDWSKERTADFRELLDRLDGTKPRIESEMPLLTLTPDTKADLIHLNDLRCGLVHIMPVGWGIEIEGLPRLAFSGARVVQQIVHNGYIFRVMDDEAPRSLRLAIDALVEILQGQQI